MSCGRYAKDFDIPVRAPKWPSRMMFSQGHVSVRKLVQSYDVDMLTCGTFFVSDMWHELRALREKEKRFKQSGVFLKGSN